MNRFFYFPFPKVNWLLCSLIAFVWLETNELSAQYAELRPAWDRDFGGNIWEDLHAIEETADGGYILAGFSSSSENGDVTEPTRGVGDFWVVKTNDQGIMQWNYRYGGVGMEQAWAVKQTADGGYLLGGWSDSDISGEKSTDSRGYLDYWVVRIDATGNYLWDQTYGGDSTEFLYDLEITSDGGFVIGGMSHSGAGGEKSQANRGDMDIWVIKADANGVLQWERSYGGNSEERLNEIVIDADGNFLIGGGTRSDVGGDITQPNYGVKDFWLIKIDQTNGDLIWTRRYGGDDEDEIISLILTSDNGILMGGSSRSNPGFDKTEPNEGISDMWVVKTDLAGNVLWDRTFGGAELENCYAVKENSIGDYIIGGYSGSDAGIHKTENSRGGFDYWILYLDPDGNKKWDKTFGGDRDDVLENLLQTSDGSYVLAGHSQSDPSGDKTSPNKGLNDFWIIKTDCALMLDLPDTIACPDQEFLLDAYDPQCQACNWRWNDDNTDSVRTIISTTDMTYSVSLTDGVGCIRSDEVQVVINPAASFGAEIQVLSPQCFGENNGEVLLTTINDSISTFLISFNNQAYGEQRVFNNLSAGYYPLSIQDANGCEWDTLVRVDDPPLLILDIGPDVELEFGDSTLLVPFVNQPLLGYLWTPDVYLSQPDSFVTYAKPLQTTRYDLSVTDSLGCTVTESVLIKVNKERRVYIPNVFSPNFDGYNDEFTVFGGKGVETVRLLQVFDRWGALVFEARDFQPNIPSLGWNGIHNGKKVNPGVYLYIAIIAFSDGTENRYQGDVTVVK